jgi:hypothetical protein
MEVRWLLRRILTWVQLWVCTLDLGVSLNSMLATSPASMPRL